MGSWNATCNISQLPIMPGDKVRVLFLARCPYSMDAPNELALGREGKNSCEGVESTSFWHPRTVPLKATYDDSGDVTNVDGTSLSYSLFEKQLREDLIDTPEGENQYHDPAMSKSPEHMAWGHMWWVATEGRLRINGMYGHFTYPDGYVGPDGKMREGVPSKARALPVCPVLIREDVYQAMIQGPMLEKTYEPESGVWDSNAKHVYKTVDVPYFKEKLEASFERLMELQSKLDQEHLTPSQKIRESLLSMRMERENCTLQRMSPPFSLGITFYFEELVRDIQAGKISKDDPRVDTLFTQIAEIELVMQLMSALRKTWHPGTGCGSQGSEWGQSYVFYAKMAKIAAGIFREEQLEGGGDPLDPRPMAEFLSKPVEVKSPLAKSGKSKKKTKK